jgi:hypothetical protein
MNSFAISDAASNKSSENPAASFDIREAYHPDNRLLPARKEARSLQTDALVQSGVLPNMPIDGLSNEASSNLGELTANSYSVKHDTDMPPQSREAILTNLTDETKERGRELAKLIESGRNGGQVMELVEKGLASGDLEGLILTANIELEKGPNPSRISLLLNEPMTKADISVTSIGSNAPMLAFSVEYEAKQKNSGIN